MASAKTNVVVLGAGVIGLTIASVLTEGANAGRFNVSIVARDLPEDVHSQGYASPWAGANWSPMQVDARLNRWEKRTVERLREMVPSGLAMNLPTKIYFEDVPNEEYVLYCKGVVQDFHLSTANLPEHPNIKAIAEFVTVSVNPRLYLPALKSELEKRGVSFTRHRAVSLDEVCVLAGDGGIVVNAASLGARSLLGVEDTKVFPVRGQTILLHAPKARECVIALFQRAGVERVSYLIPRPGPTNEAVLGGTMQAGNWDTSVDWDTAKDIFSAGKEYVPALNGPDVRIIQHNVGLRPAREGGPRVETELYSWPSANVLSPRSHEEVKVKRTLVVHAYGFSGAGYQQSWGAAEEAVELLEKAMSS